MLELGREAADPHTQMWAHLWHIDAAFERGDLLRVARELEALSWCVDQVRGPHARYELLKCRAVLAQAQARFGDAMRLADEAFSQLATIGDDIGFHERAGLLSQIGLHIGHEATGSLEASGYADVTVFERELPTAGVIVAVANAHLLASLGRLDEAAAIFRSLGPPAEWKPSPHATLPAFAFGVNLAIEVGATVTWPRLCSGSACTAVTTCAAEPDRSPTVVRLNSGPVAAWPSSDTSTRPSRTCSRR